MSKRMTERKTFVKISNEDIFSEIESIKDNIELLKIETNTTALKIARELQEYKSILQGEQTNQRISLEELKGMIRLNQWLATSSLAVAGFAIGWISHLARIV